jgi:hypothetical protein
LDIAAEELQNSGELDAQTVAAKVERIVDDADRNLTDIYHVMNLQRLHVVFSPFPQKFNTRFCSRNCPNDLPPQRISAYKERLELQIQGECCCVGNSFIAQWKILPHQIHLMKMSLCVKYVTHFRFCSYAVVQRYPERAGPASPLKASSLQRPSPVHNIQSARDFEFHL